MCLAEFVADAPYKRHFLDAHGLDDDPGTETRLPEDAPPPEPEPAPERSKKRRGRAGATRPESGTPPVAPAAPAAPVVAQQGSAAPSAPVDGPADGATDGSHRPDADAHDVPAAATAPEPIVVIPAAEPEPEPERSRAVRLVTVAGAVVVVLAFLLAAGRLTGSEEPARAAGVADSSVPVTAPAPPPTPAPASEQYVVARGDSLSAIAGRVGVPLDALVAANGIANPNLIYVGQVLTVPR